MRTNLFTTVLCLMIAGSARGGDWPQWRGPTGQGRVEDTGLPTTWDGKTGANVLWKTALPKGDTPYSSPIVRGDRVFVTLAMNKSREHHVLCFDKKEGKQLWDTEVPPGPWNLTDLRGGYAASTPAADGERVYVLFGSAVLAAIDFDGKIAWRTELPRHAFDVAIGCSPIVYGDTVIIQADMVQKQSSLMAFDRKMGEMRWEVKRPEVGFAHSTPTIVTVGEKPLMLVAASDALQGVDPANGAVRWWCKAKGDTVSPVFSEGMAYVDSGRGGPGFGVAVDGAMKGDVSKTALRWTIRQIAEGFGSPVIVGPHLYRLHAPGILKCYGMVDGAAVYSQRLEGASPAVSPIVTGDGTIYFASSGRSYVIKAGAKYEQVAVNNLDDPNYASPAVADGRIYLKGQRFLYCLGRKVP
jgi:outer membrane protein assembly factor BamB